ncbi:hypothetical protein [Jatrophihabitans sp.]|uniref:hypothetical protein n=1 Tax=Jatrophihabitans sp. TaxID=1932789 RepID=UPI0030C72802|nr:hypothetical protein [Jatrophihabitans sp.]
MRTSPGNLASKRVRVGVLLMCVVLALVGGYDTLLPASAHALAAGPQLSVSVSDGRASAASGDRLSYAIRLTNLGQKRVGSLVVTQTVPTGLHFTSQAPPGTARPGTVTWTSTLAPSASNAFHTTMAVTATPAQLLRLATVVCVSASAKAAPIVCASDSDQLPAGAAAQASRAPREDAATSRAAASAAPWYWGGGVAVLLVLSWLVLRRVRSRTVRT